MPYLAVVNEMTMTLRDDENRQKTKDVEINSIFTATDNIADAFHNMMRGAVTKYIYRQKQAFDGTLDLGTEGDVFDKTNLVFLNDRYERVVLSVYDVAQACFVATTGANARVVKDLAVLEAGAVDSPEEGMAEIINWVLDGTIIIGGGDTILEYVEGYKVD